MPSHKIGRATEDVKRELSDIIRSLKDPRITGMISILGVDLTNDYSQCTVYVSSLDGLESAQKAVEGLKSAAGFVRREIGHRLKFRRTPEFLFIADDGIAHSAGIHQILRNLNIPKDDGETTDED